MKKPIISVSGLRGILGESLSPLVAMQYATAFSTILKEGPVVITRDGRASGTMLADAIQSALMAVGRDVVYGDVAATPTTGVMVRGLQAAGGIQISASHNPAEYNGIKLFGGDGRVVGAAQGRRVMEAMGQEPDWVAFDGIGQSSRMADTTSQHLDLVLDTVDVEVIRSHNLTFLNWTTINIFSQVGFITLVGLVSKNAILIVEFANQLQAEGHSRLDAIREAATTRLRPVLMTTGATVLGHFPLILVSGAGAAARNSIGIILVAGMLVGTMFTLFILPSVYMTLASRHERSNPVKSSLTDARS